MTDLEKEIHRQVGEAVFNQLGHSGDMQDDYDALY